MISTGLLNKFLEDYLRELHKLLPQSNATLWTIVGGRPKIDDGKLIKMLEFAKSYGEIFKYCTHLQATILILRISGKIYTPAYQRIGFTSVQSDGGTRPLTKQEIIDACGLTLGKYNSEIARARHSVKCAIAEKLGKPEVVVDNKCDDNWMYQYAM